MVRIYLGPDDPHLVAIEQKSFVLNNDIIITITNYLSIHDALAFSLSCRHIFNITRSSLRHKTYARKYRQIGPSLEWDQLPERRRWHEYIPTYSPSRLSRHLRKDPLIGRHIQSFHVHTALRKLKGGMDDNKEKKHVQKSLMEFLKHVTFLTDTDKLEWAKLIVQDDTVAVLISTIIVCSTLPELTTLSFVGALRGSEISYFNLFAKALRSRQSIGGLFNSSPLLLNPQVGNTYALRCLTITEGKQNQVLSNSADPVPSLRLADLVDICLIPSLLELCVGNVFSRSNHIFEWPLGTDNVSAIMRVRFWSSALDPRSAYTFMLGLPALTVFALTDLKLIPNVEQWIEESFSLEAGMVGGRDFCWGVNPDELFCAETGQRNQLGASSFCDGFTTAEYDGSWHIHEEFLF